MSQEVPALVADTDNLHRTVTALQRDAGRSDSMPPRAGRGGLSEAEWLRRPLRAPDQGSGRKGLATHGVRRGGNTAVPETEKNPHSVKGRGRVGSGALFCVYSESIKQ